MYSDTEFLDLAPQHAQLLKASGITPEQAKARGYRSVRATPGLDGLNIAREGRSVPGLLIPLLRANGTRWGWQYRPDSPRERDGKPVKYESPHGQHLGLDVPPGVGPLLADPKVCLFVTEGSRKADAAACQGLACVALLGVWGWLGTNERDGKTALAEWRDVALNGRRVVLAFDSDVIRKPSVRRALDELARYLTSKGAKVEFLHLPDAEGKCGLDDYLAEHTVDELWSLVHPEPPAPTDPHTTPMSKSVESVGFRTIRIDEVNPMATTYVVPGLVPRGDLVVLVGEEGIGKGLFWTRIVAERSRAGRVTLLICGEDDYQRVVRPRLDVVGADLSKVVAMVLDPATMTGQPLLPLHEEEVAQAIRDTGADLLILDPWVSVVQSGLRLRDTQDARAALGPLQQMARSLSIGILAVAHPNRGDGSLRDRVGLTAVLRQSARVLVFALEDPDDPTTLYVGVEKANGMRRANATRYRKTQVAHEIAGEVSQVDKGTPTEQTIRARDAALRPPDGRTTEKWATVVEAADKGMVTRAQIVEVYDDNEHSADAAIGRWVKAKRLARADGVKGVYEVVTP